MAWPMMRSDSPPAYDSALSKKLTPASRAAAMQSEASPMSIWSPKVTHEPKDSTLTFSPERPSLRYCISIPHLLLPTSHRAYGARWGVAAA